MDDTRSDARHRFAAPSAEVADVTPEGRVELAGRGTRLAAAIIDGLIILALFWVVGVLTPWNVFTGQYAQAGFLVILGMQALGFGLLAAINGWLLAKRGQTVGKMLLGLRITRKDGSHPSLLHSLLLRYGVGYLISAIPLIGMFFWLVDSLFIFRANRRCIHDLIADTVVVKS
jgi:uncharacterized RDD family membrane protein YckC